MEKKLTNKVAVVTGGSAGIGLGAAKHFVKSMQAKAEPVAEKGKVA